VVESVRALTDAVAFSIVFQIILAILSNTTVRDLLLPDWLSSWIGEFEDYIGGANILLLCIHLALCTCAHRPRSSKKE